MYCFRDMTFCEFHKECADGEECHRALTEKVKEKARDVCMPISRYGTKPKCFVDYVIKAKGE